MDQPPEDHSTVADAVAGFLYLAGLMGLLVSLPLGVWFALPVLKDGWPWTWFVALALALAAAIAAYSLVLIFIASTICRWKSGIWPDVFWSSKNNEHSKER